MKNQYKRTEIACFMGIFVQAIITNLTPILFIPLMSLYGLSYVHLGILAGVNFSTQVASDIIFSGMIDKIGFRRLLLPTVACAFVGLLLFVLAPLLFSNVFIGILLATIVFAASSGLLEVILSPLINAIPYEDKGPAMSLMHSFYAWGQSVTIIVTTLFLYFFGSKNWQWIVLFWALVPVADFILFFLSPFPKTIPEELRQNMKDLLFNPFFLFACAAIFLGAGTEVTMNQWASAFTEKALMLPKLTGDLLGMCGFAVMLGLGRVLYGMFGNKININKVLIIGSAVSVLCYLTVSFSTNNALNLFACALTGLTSSLLWPGTLIISSEKYPLAGAWMFAILAAAGDIGAAFGPWLTGQVVDFVNRGQNLGIFKPLTELSQFSSFTQEQIGIRAGILIATIFPLLAVLCHVILTIKKNKFK